MDTNELQARIETWSTEQWIVWVDEHKQDAVSIKGLMMALLKNKKYNQCMEILSHTNFATGMERGVFAIENAASTYFGVLKNMVLGESESDLLTHPSLEVFIKMVFWVFYANDKEVIAQTKSAAKNFLFALADQNIEHYFVLLQKYDTALKTIEVALRADKVQTVHWLVDRFLKENSICAKRVLSAHLQELMQYYASNQKHLLAKHKTKLIRLLALYKQEAAVANYLSDLAAIEDGKTAQLIADLLGKVKKSKPKPIYKIADKYHFDGSGVATFEGEYGKATYTIDEEFFVVNASMPESIKKRKAYTAFENGLANSVQSRLDQLEKFMCLGEVIEGQEFLRLLQEDWFFAQVAESLVFGYWQETLCLVLVDEGRVIDIHGNQVDIEDKQLQIVHPIHFFETRPGILQQAILQPFEQLKRKVYSVLERDKHQRSISLYDSRLLDKEQIDKLATVFRIDKDGKFATQLIADLYLTLELEQMGQDCKIKSLAFYKKTDIKLLRDNFAFVGEGITLGNIPKAMYSEAIRTIENLLQ
ncbi:MAG: DUF4132 domain-containing protein [Firmicutes bacterium]|nr:DUF4132 domain-containing protein [Bacillota bacterium]